MFSGFFSDVTIGSVPHFFTSASKFESKEQTQNEVTSTMSNPLDRSPKRFNSLVDRSETLLDKAIHFQSQEDKGDEADADESPSRKQVYRTLSVHIVHRHGDRTPVTPLKDEEYWATCLVPDKTLENIASNTTIVKSDSPSAHFGKGGKVFGNLSELGLEQMVNVGARLRRELSTTEQANDVLVIDDNGHHHYSHVWNPKRPLHPSNIQVFSTDFPRTIQSAQGLLVGLFPNGCCGSENTVPIDLRNASWMMPDPILLRKYTKEFAAHPLAADEDILRLGIAAAQALQHMLSSGQQGGIIAKMPIGSFYIDNGNHVKKDPAAWIQLSEVVTCLSLRDRLPAGITKQDCVSITQHAAKWSFELLGHPDMAMDIMVRSQLGFMERHASEPPVTVWSGHDFSLIGMMLAYKLEQPAVWPEYGSFLKLELLQVSDLLESSAAAEDDDDNDDSRQECCFVRFSLNGEKLRSRWSEDGELVNMVSLDLLKARFPSHG